MVEDGINNRLTLAHHRIVARALRSDPGLVDEARGVVDAWKAHSRDPPFVGSWESLLAGSTEALQQVMVADDVEAADLRRTSPFVLVSALILDHERVQKLWRIAAGHATRILPHTEYPKYTRHLKKLDENDRFQRFSRITTDDCIDRYVAGIGADEAIIGHYGADLELDGAIHVGLIERGDERYAEIGVSVLPAVRHHGIGYHLLHRAALWARNHGAVRLYIVCRAGNHEMIKLAHEHDIEVHRKSGEAEGVLVFQTGDAGSVSEELLENQIGEWDFAAKAHDTAFAFTAGASAAATPGSAPNSDQDFARSRLDKLAAHGRIDVLAAYLIVLRYALLMQSEVSPRIYRSHLAAVRSSLAAKLAPHPEAQTYIMGLPTDDIAPMRALAS
jgi:GNAT superfamily N-acetyltransferase